MKKVTEILLRISKVFYVILLLLGIGFGWYVWILDTPIFTSYNYRVICTNGKTFDPLSKPIFKVNYDNRPYYFFENELAAECLYGNAARSHEYTDIPQNVINEVTNHTDTYNYSNSVYTLSTISHLDYIGLIKTSVIRIILYYLFLEILRRTFLYIFHGTNFITLKKVNKKKN